MLRMINSVEGHAPRILLANDLQRFSGDGSKMQMMFEACSFCSKTFERVEFSGVSVAIHEVGNGYSRPVVYGASSKAFSVGLARLLLQVGYG